MYCRGKEGAQNRKRLGSSHRPASRTNTKEPNESRRRGWRRTADPGRRDPHTRPEPDQEPPVHSSAGLPVTRGNPTSLLCRNLNLQTHYSRPSTLLTLLPDTPQAMYAVSVQGAWCFAHNNLRNSVSTLCVIRRCFVPISPLVHLVEVALRAEVVGRILRTFIGEAENLRLAHRRRHGAVVAGVKAGIVQL